MKRIACLLLIAALCIVPVYADNTSGTCGSSLVWEYADGTLKIDGNGQMYDYETESYVPWHALRNEITTVKIGPGVTSICNRAFLWCSNLTEVQLDEDSRLSAIGDFAFSGCSSLTAFELPGKTTKLGTGVFNDCPKLELSVSGDNLSFAVTDGLLLSRDGHDLIFATDAVNLSDCRIPDGVVDIAPLAFSASQVERVSVSASVRTIGERAFAGCSQLTSIVFAADSALEEIGDAAFAQCIELGSIYFPKSLKTISGSAFSGCASLSSIQIPKNVASIGTMAFSDCSSLLTVTIKGMGTTIQKNAFSIITGWGEGAIDQNFYPPYGFRLLCIPGSRAEDYAIENSISYSTVSGKATLDNFTVSGRYADGMFTDVDESTWYGTEKQATVKLAYELGIMDGVGNNCFAPENNVKISELLKVAVVIRDIYEGTGGIISVSGSPWYSDCLQGALDRAMIGSNDFTDLDAVATRAEAARILSSALPESEFLAGTKQEFQDVTEDTPYTLQIGQLSAAGILQGDENGLYRPDANLSRAELATIVVRLVLDETRSF